MLNPFADYIDVEAIWVGKTLDSQEQVAADALIARASAIVRIKIPDVDVRIAAGTLDEVLVRGVVSDMVKQVMINPTALRQFSMAIDDRVESGTYDPASSSSELVMTAGAIQLLRGRSGARAFMITPGAGVPAIRRDSSLSIWPDSGLSGSGWRYR